MSSSRSSWMIFFFLRNVGAVSFGGEVEGGGREDDSGGVSSREA